MTDIVKLGDIGRFVSGGTPSRKHPEYYEGSIPWVSTPALNGGLLDESNAVQFITEDAISKSATKLISPHSLLVGLRVGVGKTGVNTVPMCTNQDIVALTDVDDTSWDIRYLSYAVQAKSAYLVSQKQGATITGITTKLLKSLNVRRLDIDMQRRYVSNLDGVKSRIDSCAIQLVKLDELVKSRFVEMFGDPIENPKGWVKKPIGEVYEVGSAKRVYARDQVSEGIPFLRLGDLTNRIQQGVESCDLYIAEELYEEYKAKGLVPDAGDILVTARGTMGLCYEVKPEDRFYFQDGMITWLHAKTESPLPVFLTSLFANGHFDEDLHEHTSGTTVKYLSIKTLSQLRLILPPLALQQEFATFVRQVDKLRVVAEKEKQTLQTLYDSLAQEYFAI